MVAKKAMCDAWKQCADPIRL